MGKSAVPKEAVELIRSLSSGKFYAVCPCCDEEISLKQAGLFWLDQFTDKARGVYEGMLEALKESRDRAREDRRRLKQRSETAAHTANIGFVLERLAPAMKSFRFNPGDCRSLFDPIDYVIFEGLSEKGRVDRIFFVDVKTGQARLNSTQKEIRDLVGQKRVEWDVYDPEVK